MIKAIIESLKSMMRSKSGKVAVDFIPSFKLVSGLPEGQRKSIENFVDNEGYTHERVVCPKDYSISNIEDYFSHENSRSSRNQDDKFEEAILGLAALPFIAANRTYHFCKKIYHKIKK